ncbi:protein rep, partial [Staphylococcus hominis]|uniref:protein rep n=1 Tax=Staphylococcus hominis TaxID=1290 RepID=UPI001642DA49
LCAVCNWRGGMKNSYQAEKVIEEVVKEKGKAGWLFLTLSTKNPIDRETLQPTLKHLTQTFRTLFKYKKLSKNLIAFM